MHRVSQACRSLARSPWYASAAIMVIALGVGLTTAVFAVVDGVLFKPLPYPDAAELYGVSARVASRGGITGRLASVSQAHLDAWREAVPLARFTGYNASGFDVYLDGEWIEIAQVDEEFLEVVGLAPHLGGFRSGDFARANPGITPVLIAFDVWQQRFAGDPSIVGRTFANPAPSERDFPPSQVVGVLHPDFIFPSGAGALKPQALVPRLNTVDNEATKLARTWTVLARVPADVPQAFVDARLTEATGQVAKRYPPTPAGRPSIALDAASLVSIRVALTTATRTNFSLFMAAAAALLLLACINVTGLSAARMLDRQKEFAVRRALGAGTRHLAALLFTETTLIMLPAAVIGLAVGFLLTDLVRQLIPGYRLFKTLAVDIRVALFVILATASCGVVVAIAGVRAARTAAARAAGDMRTGSPRPLAVRTLITGQVAIAVALVMAGCLFVKSVATVWQEEPGFATEGGFRIEVEAAVRGGAQDVAQINELMSAVRRVPGVLGAGGLGHPFLQQIFNGSVFDAPPGADTSGIESFQVTAGFLTAAGLNAVEGRLPTDQEFETGARVLAVSRRAASRYWPDRSALGQTLSRDGESFVVVGVVRDVRYRSLDVEPGGEVYYSIASDPRPFLWNAYVRFAPGGEGNLSSVLAAISHSQAYRIVHVQSARQSYAEAIRARRFSAWVFASFAACALVIVGTGILGLLAMTTARRTRELGIRAALGASPSGLVRMILTEQLAPVAAGVVAGMIVSYWFVQVVRESLYRFDSYRNEVWLATAVLVLLVGSLGALAPALRAAKVDPTEALRAE